MHSVVLRHPNVIINDTAQNGEVATVGAQGQRCDRARERWQREQRAAVVGTPQANRMVAAARGEPAAIRAEGDGSDGAIVAHELAQRLQGPGRKKCAARGP